MPALALCAVVLASTLQDEPVRKATKTGAIQEISVSSKILHNERKVWVWTPPQYAKEPGRRFPVLYMNDGQNCFDGMTSYIPNGEWRADETADSLIRAGLVEPVIIVAVSNAGMDRGNEYLPTKVAPNQGSEDGAMGGRADDYGRFLTDELMPLVNREFRTDPRPEKTGLIGSSFGGVVTLHLGMTRSDRFRRLGVVSPSLWWDGGVMLKRAEEHEGFKKKGFRMWVDMGGLEGAGGVIQARKLAQILKDKGLAPGRDYAYVEEQFAEHNEFSWARRLGAMMMFLYPAGRS